MQSPSARISVEEQRSFGHLENLSSPLLEKLREAASLVAAASDTELISAARETFGGEHGPDQFDLILESCFPRICESFAGPLSTLLGPFCAGRSEGWPQVDRGYITWEPESRSLSIAFKVRGTFDFDGRTK